MSQYNFWWVYFLLLGKGKKENFYSIYILQLSLFHPSSSYAKFFYVSSGVNSRNVSLFKQSFRRFVSSFDEDIHKKNKEWIENIKNKRRGWLNNNRGWLNNGQENTESIDNLCKPLFHPFYELARTKSFQVIL